MHRSQLLYFLSRELEGGVLTSSSLAAYAAIERARERMSMSPVAAQAAALAALLPTASSSVIRREFPDDTVRVYRKLLPTGDCVPLSVMAEGVHADALHAKSTVTRDAAIALIAAETSVVSAHAREALMESLDRMASSETDAARTRFLQALSSDLQKGTTDPESASHHGGRRILSISVDICGSTDLKVRMKSRARDVDELQEWYRAFQSRFLLLECRFYESLFHQDKYDLNLNWKRIFFVKGIGDEFWLLYDIPDDELWALPGISVRLLHCALELANSTITWFSCSDNDEVSTREHESRRLPLKVYLDLVEHAFEVSALRRDCLSAYIPNLLDPDDSARSAGFIELGNRLSAAVLLAGGRRQVAAIRSDYIGWEIDRFFRVSHKSAIPCVATVGETLFDRIADLSEERTDGSDSFGLRRLLINYPIDEGKVSTKSDRSFVHVEKILRQDELKGMQTGYRVHHVLRDRDVSGLHHNGVDGETMKPATSIFTAEMAHLLRHTPV